MTSSCDKKNCFYNKICYIIVENDQFQDLFIIEYKSANKLISALVLKKIHDIELNRIIHQVEI